jgi:hypothetical protein
VKVPTVTFRAIALRACTAVVFLLGASLSGAQATRSLVFRPTDAQNAVAFDHFYNLEFDAAIREFQQIVDRHPNDPFAVNHLLTGVLFQELYRMGALNTGDYANDSFVGKPHRPADPNASQRIRDLVDRASKLEEDRLGQNSKDVDALYARGVTRAQFSTYTALIERAWFSALRNAVGARRDHERVLEMSPSYTDAKLIVGTHNYVVGSLPWGVKVAVAMVRLSGNKQVGLDYLKDSARANGETSVDAKILLALFDRREHQFADAIGYIRSLVPTYPRNVLLALEEGNLLRADGKLNEAAAVYRRIWQAGREGKYSGLHYEFAALSLGDTLRAEKDYSGAASAYDDVSRAENPDPDVVQRADLNAGEVYDLLQKRDLALRKYQAVIASKPDNDNADLARKRLKEPYKED